MIKPFKDIVSHRDYAIALNIIIAASNWKSLPQINPTIYWHHDYYDFRMSGVCDYNGQKCKYHCVEQFDDVHPEFFKDPNVEHGDAPWYRRFAIFKISDEYYSYLKDCHSKFCRMVGYHSDYTKDGTSVRSYLYGDSEDDIYTAYGEKVIFTATNDSTTLYYKEARELSKLDIQYKFHLPKLEDFIGWEEV